MKRYNASITDIPEELQIDILSWLPSNALSRCKCVSKHWNTTLTIQAFMLRHSRSYDKHSKLAFVAHSKVKGYNTILSFELEDKITLKATTITVPKTTKLRVANRTRDSVMPLRCTVKRSTEEVILGHKECFTDVGKLHFRYMSNICNDLVCLFDDDSTCVGLLNVKTQDFIRLPAVTTKSVGVNLFWYALGFDLVNKVFKLLSIRSKGARTKAMILTLGSKQWKKLEYRCILPGPVTINLPNYRKKNSFCLDGVIYWVNQNKTDDTSVLTVVAFDLNRELFRDYKLDMTTMVTNAKTINYYLTSLKGYPTLFIWQMGSDEIQQLTLFNHKNPEAAWNSRSFTVGGFPKDFPFGGCHVAGGSILLKPVKRIKSSVVEPEEKDKSLSCNIYYDLENFAVE